MSFDTAIKRTPIPYDRARATATQTLFADMPADVGQLLGGTAGCSPYLCGLIERNEQWLRGAMRALPHETLAQIHGGLAATALADLPVELRAAKAKVALLVALADLGGVWSLSEVTGALTDFADLVVTLSMRALVGAEITRGKLPPVIGDGGDTAGMVTLAMGKMGARELNYSSDIDLICLFDESRFRPDDWADARMAFVRVTRKMTAMLSDMTGEGYVFRTDLRLRPDPGVTPVCMAMTAAERYYESVGRTWERAAHIKARAAAGDLTAGAAYLERLTPFVWRRHLDFAAIQDAQDMARRIRDHKGLGGPITLAGHDVKLGQGGIREIEFFAQTGQLIFGGRDPDLRPRGTTAALNALADKGRIDHDTARILSDDYTALREVEHRLQMVNDAQTHSLPTTDEGFDRIARFMGEGDTSVWKSALFDRLTRVHALTEGFLAPSPAKSKPHSSEQFREITARWRSYPALRSSRALESFGRMRGDLLGRFSQADQPDQAIAVFDSFLAGLPAGAQLFALFEANPQLVDLIVDIAATAPGLARYLSRNAGVFDAVIAGEFFSDWPGAKGLSTALLANMASVDDYEGKLDVARRWTKEWHFRIGVHHLRALNDANDATHQYADLAQAVLAALFPVVAENFALKHGGPPGRGAVVLGMGSLGAGRLNAGSDLDLIVIYDATGAEASQGRRPLAARAYYARLTQALVTALSAPTAEGRLYEVDMRLRPSGRQGPVATSLGAFTAYQENEAWTWEHLALTRARPVAGSGKPAQSLTEDIESFRQAHLQKAGGAQKTLADVAAMRARLAQEKPGNGPWEAKLGPGRMQDIELVAETAALLSGSPRRDVEGQLASGVAYGWLTDAQSQELVAIYGDFLNLNASARLLSDRPFSPEDVGAGGQAFLLRSFGETSLAALQGRLDAGAARASEIIAAAMGSGVQL